MTEEEIKKIVEKWLIGMTVASFNFSVGFILRLEREEPDPNSPSVLYLELKSQAMFGDSKSWQKIIEKLPISARRGEPDEPAIAYMIMLMIGAKITSASLMENGTLSIGTIDDDVLILNGVEEVWDESWIITAKSDLNEIGGNEILCNSDGEVSFS